MFLGDLFLTRGRLPLSSFLCFIGGFSMGSWLTLFHQLQAQKDLIDTRINPMDQGHSPIVFLAVLIVSAPSHRNQRSTIRSTWLQHSSSSKIKHFFVIGTSGINLESIEQLQQESNTEEDLLLIPDLVDSFQNLTTKVLLGISLISKNVPFNYLLKCDDDSFVRLDNILQTLESIQSKYNHQCFYWGYFDGRAQIQSQGKWKQSQSYVLCDTYLPYALGGGYVISKSCSDFIRINYHRFKTYVNEDVTMGTILSSIQTHRLHDERFDTEWESRGCSNQYLIQHKISQSEMIQKHALLKSQNIICKHEFKKRSGYHYNWQVPPSHCCQRNASII